MSKVALFGISGLVGSSTAPLLANSFASVLAPVRKPYGNQLRGIETPVVDFEHLSVRHADLLHGVQCVVYCLGTTLRQAGSVDEFRRIEWQLATQVSELARRAKVSRFVLLSASGANPESVIPYSRVKGEIERFVSELDFSELLIARPSLLVGERAEMRMIEGVSIRLTRPWLKPLQRFLPKLAPIQDIQVARALTRAATTLLKSRLTVWHNDELLEQGGAPIRSVISV